MEKDSDLLEAWEALKKKKGKKEEEEENKEKEEAKDIDEVVEPRRKTEFESILPLKSSSLEFREKNLEQAVGMLSGEERKEDGEKKEKEEKHYGFKQEKNYTPDVNLAMRRETEDFFVRPEPIARQMARMSQEREFFRESPKFVSGETMSNPQEGKYSLNQERAKTTEVPTALKEKELFRKYSIRQDEE